MHMLDPSRIISVNQGRGGGTSVMLPAPKIQCEEVLFQTEFIDDCKRFELSRIQDLLPIR